jgi:hypothetical protein
MGPARFFVWLAAALSAAACGKTPEWPGPGAITADTSTSAPMPSPAPAPPSAPASTAAAATPSKQGGSRATGVLGAEAIAAWDALPAAEKNRVKAARVFFGHQSVGGNTLEGVEALGYPVHEVSGAADYGSPGIGHAYLESNTEPLQKILNFERFLGRLGGNVQVAAMKLCWIDFEHGTNVGAIETRYQTVLAGLRAAHPKVTFFHVTTPIKTDDPGANARRLAYGDWLKTTYARESIVLDLAGIQSTKGNGAPCMNGATRAMCTEYASDEGHLNAQGSARAAKAFLYAIYKLL